MRTNAFSIVWVALMIFSSAIAEKQPELISRFWINPMDTSLVDGAIKMAEIPSNVQGITENWLRKVILQGELEKLDMSDIAIKHSDPDKQDGLLSSITRASFKLEDGQGNKKRHQVFIKVMPRDKIHHDLMVTGKFDVTEVETYNRVFVDLKAFEESILGHSTIMDIVPKIYSGKYSLSSENRNFYLMLQDVSDRFKMVDFSIGLTVAQLAKSLEALAEFHGTAFCLKQINRFDLNQKYDFLGTFFHDFEKSQEMREFIDLNMQLVEEDLETSSEASDMLPLVRKLREKSIAKLFKSKILSENHQDFLIHGDLWANNVMFDHNNDCKLVDWQFTCLGNVFLDFGTMAFLSMAAKDTESNMATLSEAYFNRFASVCANLGCKEKMPWTKEEFTAKAWSEGSLLAFLWCSTSYELVTKYPPLKERVHWTLRTAISRNPLVFQ